MSGKGGRHQFKLTREQRGEGVVAHQLKGIDVSDVEMLCYRKQEIVGHILERGHGRVGEKIIGCARLVSGGRALLPLSELINEKEKRAKWG